MKENRRKRMGRIAKVGALLIAGVSIWFFSQNDQPTKRVDRSKESAKNDEELFI